MENGIDTEKGPKVVYFNGVRYCLDDVQGYYRSNSEEQYLHRAVYKAAFGEIPDGMQVHHKDGNKLNNHPSNYELLTLPEHMALHMAAPARRDWARANFIANAHPAAKKWHGSDAGLRWHSEHGKATAESRPVEVMTCAHCGARYEAKRFGVMLYCSNKCRAAARRASGADNETRRCDFCGSPFTVNKYRKTTTCGLSCANKRRHSNGKTRPSPIENSS